jgi:hypothetical protein
MQASALYKSLVIGSTNKASHQNCSDADSIITSVLLLLYAFKVIRGNNDRTKTTLDKPLEMRYYYSRWRWQYEPTANIMGYRSTVGRLTLDQLIGVRISVPQSL